MTKINEDNPTYETGMVFNAKGDIINLGGTKVNSVGVDQYTGDFVAGIFWGVNEAEYVVSVHTYPPYAWALIKPTIPAAGGSWVDWGSVPGDENFITPPVYEINAIIVSQSGPPFQPPPAPAPGHSSGMVGAGNWLDIDQTRRLSIISDLTTVEGSIMEIVYDVTIREIADHGNSVTDRITLRLTDAIS